MSNLTLQLNLLNSTKILPNENIVFDTTSIIVGDINYNNTTGVITLNQPGIYYISWWVASQMISSDIGGKLTLISSKGDNIISNSPLKTGEIYGMGIIEVETTPINIVLKNTNSGSLFFPLSAEVKASLAVLYEKTEIQNGLACFAYSQFVNILSQMIISYPTTTWSVFSKSLASYSGVPLELYTSTSENEAGLLILIDLENGLEIFPISQITAIYVGDDTIYDENFTFLIPPSPLPKDCNTAVLDAIKEYLTIGTSVNIRLGPSVSATGQIYKNEIGVIVLSNDLGETPIFLYTPQILRIYIAEESGELEKKVYQNPKIELSMKK